MILADISLPQLLFRLGNLLVLPGWLLLVFLPRWAFTQRLTYGTGFLSLLLAAGYTVLLAGALVASGTLPDFGSIAGVRALMADDRALAAGWLHYLAFDLFVGSWQVTDAQTRSIPHRWVVPCLVLTFLAGPVGLLLYAGLRNFWKSS